MTAQTATAGLTREANVNVSRLAGNQVESSVAVNPLNAAQIFAVSGSVVVGQLFAARSTDGGTTWLPSNGADYMIADGQDALAQAQGDPVVAWDAYGNLFLAYVRYGATNHIAINMSTNGGVSFAQIADLVGTGTIADRPVLAVGPGTGGNGGTLWIAFADYQGTNQIVVRGVAVNGLGVVALPFSPTALLPGSLNRNMGSLAVGPIGQVVAVGHADSAFEGPATVYVNIDPDGLGAAPFGNPQQAATTNVGAQDFIPAQPDRGVDSAVAVAFDRSLNVHRGRLYLLYTDEMPQESNDLDVFVKFSDANGAVGSWSAATRVNDDTSTNSQFLPQLAIDQSAGSVGVCWHDARNDRGGHSAGDIDTDGMANTDTEFFCSSSFTGGTTWLTNARVSGGGSNQHRAEPGGLLDYGDYTGLAFYFRVLHPTWADNSNSTANNPDGATRFDLYSVRAFTSPCAGDCGGDDQVTVDEIVKAVNIMLGTAALSVCDKADLDGDGRVTVDEIDRAVQDALNGCPVS